MKRIVAILSLASVFWVVGTRISQPQDTHTTPTTPHHEEKHEQQHIEHEQAHAVQHY